MVKILRMDGYYSLGEVTGDLIPLQKKGICRRIFHESDTES